MTHLIERLAELRLHLDHLRELRPQVPNRLALERSLSLHNDVLFSLLTVCQLIIDIAGELSARRGERFEDYTEAVRNLAPYWHLLGIVGDGRTNGWRLVRGRCRRAGAG